MWLLNTFGHLKDDPGFLQQVGPHVGSDDVTLAPESDLDVLSEAAAVVIPRRLCVPDRLRSSQGHTGH